MDAVVVKIGHAGSFVEALGQTFQLGVNFVAQQVALLNEPAKAKSWGELVGSVDRLSEVAVFFKSEQNAKEGRFRQAGAVADFLETKRRFAVEAVKNLKRAANGTQIILLI